MHQAFPAALFGALLLLSVVGCAGSPTDGPGQTTNLAEPFSAEHYAVAPTDVLQIDIYREPDLSGKYYVDPSGTVNLPLLGRIYVSGLNIKAIEHKLTKELAHGYIVDPDVRVSVIQFRPVFIDGEVEKPGQYPFIPGMTVQQAIVLAGGATRFAAKKYYLHRHSSNLTGPVRVDASSTLFPGDVITIGERLF